MQKNSAHRYETASRNTEKMFAASLKKLLKELPLEKISVQKLADDCGVNRKTFYYHFDSIDDLLGWTLETDAIEEFRDVERCDDPEELLRFCIEYSDKNRKMLKKAFGENSTGFGRLKIYSGCHRIVRLMTERIEREQELDFPAEYRAYAMEFYAGALARSFYQYIYRQTPDSKEQVTGYLLTLLESGLPAALAAGQAKKSYQNKIHPGGIGDES